ncbi:hypothetical protein P7H16_02155 [Paenibacillus larvae]|nr:hypothetical protein [Paenibacillus larvae]MDT2246056.1 hypothetical protein [Paenibacillus larvae]
MLASWNRSLELAYFNQYLMTKVNKEKQVNWLLVDLGLEEKVAEDHINQVLDCMLIGFNRLFKYKCIKQASRVIFVCWIFGNPGMVTILGFISCFQLSKVTSREDIILNMIIGFPCGVRH